MGRDRDFIRKLQNDEVITPKDGHYALWKKLRTKYEEKLSHIFSRKYGFIPAQRPLLSTLTYMFLHGGFGHLLGNMIFLWIVGCVLEIGCGRVLYLLIYLLTGACSAWFFFLFNMQSTIPLIGASGAISGLMGAYTVLFGRSKIGVFYSFGFYFNYIKVPAIIILPIWVSEEIFQLLFGGISNVAYLGHVGGLLSGSLLAFILLQYTGFIKKEMFDDSPKEKIPRLLEESLGHLGRLDLDNARSALNQVFELDPDNEEALVQSFNIEKLDPDSEGFHKSAARLMHHLSRDVNAHDRMCTVYREYRSLSKKLRLRLDLLFRINAILCSRGHVKESEGILALLLKHSPGLQRIPSAILNLGRAYLKLGMKEKGEKCLKIITVRYPGSPESHLAAELIRRGTPRV
jgi:membrane associated rhomboid family serine protease